MEHPVRGDVRIALCETHPALRGGFQTALYRRGLRNIEVCKDSGALIALLQTEIVDLVICATDLPGLDFYDLIQQIRHGAIGRNPFTLILATVAEATLDDIRRIMNAGVDRVAVKPMSMGDMTACVNALATARKPFVATDSYVGPSRRATQRVEQQGSEAMDAPNTLQAKLTGTPGEGRLEMLIGRGRAALATLRLQTSCLAIARSAHRVAAHFQHRLSGPIGKELVRLRMMSEGLEFRYRDTGQAYLSEMGASLVLLADLLGDFPPGQARLLAVAVELLQKLGEAVRLAGLGDPHVAATVRSIAASVRGFAATLGVSRGPAAGSAGPSPRSSRPPGQTSGPDLDACSVVDGAPYLLNG
jgi:DNA-binding response OmpR family regulator